MNKKIIFTALEKSAENAIQINLAVGSERVPIGRKLASEKAEAKENELKFVSKVISRNHGEIWAEQSPSGRFKLMIKDNGSSGGTFHNGKRLSSQGIESAPTELRNDDILQFGEDYMSNGGKCGNEFN